MAGTWASVGRSMFEGVVGEGVVGMTGTGLCIALRIWRK